MNDDSNLRELLNEWKLPGAPASLDARVLSTRTPWWRASVRLPVPVAIAAIAILLVMAWALARRQSPPATPPAINLADFQPVRDLNVRIIRGNHESQ